MADDPPPLILNTAESDPSGGEAVVSHPGARARLRLYRRRAIPWAVFYPDWYLATYPDARARRAGQEFDAVLRDYLDHGQTSGHSPTPFFDEAWYRATYPDVIQEIETGSVESGFDHYCHGGHLTRSPHWLFEEHTYRQRSPDLAHELLVAQGLANGYGHYLRHGDREGRSGSPFFDAALYVAQVGTTGGPAWRDESPFHAFLRRLDADQTEPRTTRFFDPDWYRATYPEVAVGVVAGRWRSALHHYLTNDTPRAYDPLPLFSERDYLARYPDIAAAVDAGDWRNGYRHFLANGAAEGRVPGPRFDPVWYVTTHASVREDLEAKRAPDAFTHYLAIGRDQGLATVPTIGDELDPVADLYVGKARALLLVRARQKLDFSCRGVPDLAVIVLLRSGFALSMQALAGLRDHYRNDIELTLVDCASTDETRHILRYVDGARLVRFETPVPAIAAINAAIRVISAPTMLLLGDDTDLASGALDAALRRLHSDAKIGVVGAKLVGPDGRLHAAGGIVWRDGRVTPYLNGAAPTAPEANFMRDVDYCARGFLLARTALLQEIDGFDEAFAQTVLADADLGLRIGASGYRFVYEPNALVYQLRASSSDNNEVLQDPIFFRKHINQLRSRYLMDAKAEVFARAVGDAPKRVLFIEDLVPLRMIGSGFVRSNDLIRTMAAMGVFVTVLPMNRGAFDIAAVYADMPDTVEVMHDRTLADLDALFDARPGYYDLIWVARTHNLDRILPRLTRSATGSGRPPRVVLDTEAIAALREAARRRVSGDESDFDLNATILREFTNAHVCQNIAAVTEHEAATLRAVGFPDTVVVGHVRDLAPTSRAFDERAGLLFVGAIHEENSPNFDGLCWFIDEVLPLIERALGWETRLTVVGYTGVGVSLDRFRHHPRVTLRGSVADTVPLYDAHRVFIAPTRYAAGAPYKLYEAASFGLPVVATELLRQQLGWESGKELLSADDTDPAAFARQVLTVYRDPALWQLLRDAALARLAAENGRAHYVQALTTLLGQS
jgi:GT2 family glycosyltransferase